MLLTTKLKTEAAPALVFSSKLVAVASLLDRQYPFYQTLNSPEKNSVIKQKICRRRSGGSIQLDLAIITQCFTQISWRCFSAIPLKLSSLLTYHTLVAMKKAPDITTWHLPLAAQGTVVPLISTETTIVPGQRLMRVMPRS